MNITLVQLKKHWMQFKKTCEKHPNLVFMQKKSISLEGVRILGTTLWSFVPKEAETVVSMHLNDYKKIFTEMEDPDHKYKVPQKINITVSDTTNWHLEELAWIKSEIELAKKNNEKIIILTHHSPVVNLGCSNPEYWGGDASEAFSTDLRKLFGGNVTVWAYGHTHWFHDMVIEGTRIVSNAHGYPMAKDNAGYDATFAIEIEKDEHKTSTK